MEESRAKLGMVAAGIVLLAAVGVGGLVADAVRGGAGKPAGRAVAAAPRAQPPDERPAKPAITKPAGPGSPSPAKEGEEWTHRELFTYLASKGVPVVSAPSSSDTKNGPAMLCCPATGDAATDGTIERNLSTMPERYVPQAFRDMAYVQKRKTAADARDEAGATNGGFSWGRFLFSGNGDLADRMRKALEG